MCVSVHTTGGVNVGSRYAIFLYNLHHCCTNANISFTHTLYTKTLWIWKDGYLSNLKNFLQHQIFFILFQFKKFSPASNFYYNFSDFKIFFQHDYAVTRGRINSIMLIYKIWGWRTFFVGKVE